jgi:hypothetical protein
MPTPVIFAPAGVNAEVTTLDAREFARPRGEALFARRADVLLREDTACARACATVDATADISAPDLNTPVARDRSGDVLLVYAPARA